MPEKCHLHTIEEVELLDRLYERIRNGGCAAVVRNLVRVAQNTYEAIKKDPRFRDCKIFLYHARFPRRRRRDIKKAVLRMFDKEGFRNGQRPRKAIIVASPIIEQGLDISFDMMFSDLAPIDLIRQRIGRLLRFLHITYSDGTKLEVPLVPGLEEPHFHLIKPEMVDGLPSFEQHPFYYPSVMWDTWQLLRRKKVIRLVAETDKLIESVYGDAGYSYKMTEREAEYAKKLREQTEAGRRRYQEGAEASMIPAPRRKAGYDSFFDRDIFPNVPAEEHADDDDIAAEDMDVKFWLTRMGIPTVSVICVNQLRSGKFSLDLEGKMPFDPFDVPEGDAHRSIEFQRVLLDNSVNIAHGTCYRFLHSCGPCVQWQEMKLLRHHSFLAFREGWFDEVPGWRMQWTDEYGIRIVRRS